MADPEKESPESSSSSSSLDVETSVDEIPKPDLTAWLQVVGAFGINFTTWGLSSTYGSFQTLYTSPSSQNPLFSGGALGGNSTTATAALLPPTLLPTASQAAWIGSLQSGLLFLTAFLAGPLLDLGYFRTLLYSGAALNVGGMLALGWCKEYWSVLVCQGVMVGVGSGLLYLPGAAVVGEWFPRERRGWAFGIASGGSSLGGILLPITLRHTLPRLTFPWSTRLIALLQLLSLLPPLLTMRPRIPPTLTLRRRLIDTRLFKRWSFVHVLLGMLFGYMGIYISFFYIEVYALQECSTPSQLAAYILTVVNSGSLFGRLIPTYLADRYLGSVNLHTLFSFAAAILVLIWIAISTTPGIILFAILYGFVSGAFVSLGGPVVFSLTDDLQVLGSCLGMITGMCGLGLLLGTPVAGAILDEGGWLGLQVWNGGVLAVGGGFLLWSRLERFGPSIWKKV